MVSVTIYCKAKQWEELRMPISQLGGGSGGSNQWTVQLWGDIKSVMKSIFGFGHYCKAKWCEELRIPISQLGEKGGTYQFKEHTDSIQQSCLNKWHFDSDVSMLKIF